MTVGGVAMKYEIGREVFKQRLEERMNFALVNIQPHMLVGFENTAHVPYGSDFVAKFSSQFPNKTQNIIVYTTAENDDTVQKAADDLAASGYHFVYYYRGSENDALLDKGLN